MRAWMNGWRGLAGAGVVAAAVTMTGCKGAIATATATGATPIPVTETFSDTLGINAGYTYPFSSQAGGSITATLTSVSPDVVLGVSLGTWNGVSCRIVIANDKAAVGTSVVGTATAIGNFCARVYDVGGVTDPAGVAFTLSVFHP